MGSGRELRDRLFPRDTDYVGMEQAVAEMVQFIFELRNTFNLVKHIIVVATSGIARTCMWSVDNESVA